jgi:peroxiredoxin
MLTRSGFYVAVVTMSLTLGWSAAASSPHAQGVTRSTPVDSRAGSCVQCHDGSRSSGMTQHLIEWRQSVHGRNGVTCTDCHGGSALATTAVGAHAAHVNDSDPLSATNIRSLHRTCGRCHQQTVRLAEQNPHFQLLQRGERIAPSCVTCHGEVAADRPVPARVQAGCDQCHGARGPFPHPEYGVSVRLSIMEQGLSQQLQEEIRAVLEPLPAGPVREGFLSDLRRISELSRAAGIEGHGGNTQGLAQHLNTARQAAITLLGRLTRYFRPVPKRGGGANQRIGLALVAQTSSPPARGCDPAARPAKLAFVLKDMHDVDVRFADFKGHVVLLNFWATWCAPCKVEIPWLVDLQARFGPRGLQVLGFSVDDPPEKLKPFAAQYRVNYPLLQGLGRDDVQDAYGPIWGVPMTFLISRDSRVCRTYRGITSKEQIERDTLALL